MTASVTKGAVSMERFCRPALFYRSAREGFEDLLRDRLALGANGVLLPAFIGYSPREGSGVFDPVRDVGMPFGFYGLNGDLTVDVIALENALATQRFRTLVLIHYFGRTEPRLTYVRALADQYKVVLVEDLAHGFFSALLGGTAGRVGGASLYSLHKMFPFTQGGMMTYGDKGLIRGQRETAPEFAKAILDYDWVGIASHRRAVFAEIVVRLEKLPENETLFSILWARLAKDDAPQTLPVRVHTGNRDEIYERMNADGYGMTSLYHTLIPELRAGNSEMNALSRSIINFPVHQDVSVESIDGMVHSFRRALTDC